MYKVRKWVTNHNHELRIPFKLHMLKSYKKFGDMQAAVVNIGENSGIRHRQLFPLISNQVGGRNKHGFINNDMRNYLRIKRQQQMLEFDIEGLLEHFHHKQTEDPSFTYSLQVDENNLITNVFWINYRTRLNYQRFSDVLCFDTIYQTNRYERPFAHFVGVNYHKQTVIFSPALLCDEKIGIIK